MTTVCVIIAMVVPALGYELWTLQSDAWTISAGMRYLGQEWSLFAAYTVCVLPGHFFVQPPERWTLAGQVDEVTEVAFIVWLGWVVYVVDKAVSPALPWWGYLLFCVLCMAVGAFCWTMGG